MSHESSLTDVREFAPLEFRRWVLGGIGLTVAGYIAMGIAQRLAIGPSLTASLIYGSVAAVCAVGLLLAARGHEAVGLLLAMVATWCEVQNGFARLGYFPSAGLGVMPVLVIGFGLLAGSRRALIAMIVTVIVTYITVYISADSRPGGFDARSKYALVLYTITMVGAWVVQMLSARGFQRVVQELMQKERDLADTIRFAPDGILVLDGSLTIRLTNPAAESVLDLPQERLVGRALNEVLAEAGQQDASPTLPRDTGESATAIQLTARDGRTVHVEATWRRMEGDRRQLLLRDVTERIRADEHRREIELQLSHAQRLEAVGQLAGGLSHDFNNILTAVNGSAELLRSEPDPSEREALLDEILAAGDRGAGLTRQLLAFARRDMLQPQVIDLAAHIRSLDRLLQRVLGDRAVLRLDGTDGLRVRIDPGQLEQALINLVANARDAMPGGGTCTVSVVATANAAGETLASIHVTDDGIGMSPDVAARAFEPFFTTKPRGQGTGLGLSSVHGMASQSGGTARIVSRLGHGTQVTLEFPCVSDAATTIAMPAEEPLVATSARTILLAEDDESTRSVVARMLRQAGYRVITASDGREAWRLIETGALTLDVLLTDVMMPGLTGPELAARVHERYPLLPVLFMTGYADSVLDSVDGLTSDRHVIAKPFSMHALGARLAKLTSEPTAGESS